MIKNEIRPLTGIRGIAALWVVFFHFESNIVHLVPSLSALHPVISRGPFGVDMFFVLSGFILSSVYRIEKSNFTLRQYAEFLTNRIARIYPDYVFCFFLLALMVALDRLLGRHMTEAVNYPFSTAGWHLLMVQAWPFVPAVWHNWNTPAWSVSAEWFAYLFIFPLAV